MAIPVPVDLDWGAPTGGVLAQSRALPAGWERGVSFLDTACLTPQTMGECPSGQTKVTTRPEWTTFSPFTVLTAIECTTMGALDLAGLSGTALDRTRDYALARELLTGEASRRDASAARPDGNPALVDASDLGTADSVAEAIACLDRALAEATYGFGGVLFMGPDMVTLAKSVLWRDGARWRTPAGSSVIVSGGFDGRAPGSTEGPAEGDPLYVYASAAVWAGVGSRSGLDGVAVSTNDRHSISEDLALAAFSPCSTFAIASTAAVACSAVPVTPPVPTITAIAPSSGSEAGGDSVVITGTGFTEGA